MTRRSRQKPGWTPRLKAEEVARRVLAIIPISLCRYPRAELERVHTSSGTYRMMSGDADHSMTTIWLFMTKGRRLAVQSYSSGADNKPPSELLGRILREKFGLPVD
jgi:hypothetical protein